MELSLMTRNEECEGLVNEIRSVIDLISWKKFHFATLKFCFVISDGSRNGSIENILFRVTREI
jgi:hypothetical protein